MTACRDYDPNFKLHGCELDAHGPEVPHRDCLDSEWYETLPEELDRCISHAPWGSGWREQRCVLDALIPHETHRDRSGNEWGES